MVLWWHLWLTRSLLGHSMAALNISPSWELPTAACSQWRCSVWHSNRQWWYRVIHSSIRQLVAWAGTVRRHPLRSDLLLGDRPAAEGHTTNHGRWHKPLWNSLTAVPHGYVKRTSGAMRRSEAAERSWSRRDVSGGTMRSVLARPEPWTTLVCGKNLPVWPRTGTFHTQNFVHMATNGGCGPPPVKLHCAGPGNALNRREAAHRRQHRQHAIPARHVGPPYPASHGLTARHACVADKGTRTLSAPSGGEMSSAREAVMTRPHQEYFVKGITRVFFSGIYSYPWDISTRRPYSYSRMGRGQILATSNHQGYPRVIRVFSIPQRPIPLTASRSAAPSPREPPDK